MRLLPVLLLAAACGDDGTPLDETLAARRAALGLKDDPLPLDDAMKELERIDAEAFLRDVFAGRRTDAFDGALRIENVLARAAARDAMAPAVRAARDDAGRFARSAATGGNAAERAGDLLRSCLDCHVRFREPR